MKYQFDYQTVTFNDGYGRLEIVDGLAEVDPNDRATMALVEKHGGVPYKAKQTAKLKDIKGKGGK